METKQIICTCCPMGCHMDVTLENGKVESVVGNTCKRGYNYAIDECTDPRRTLTSSVRLKDGRMLSVKTAAAIPFGKMFEAMEALSKVTPKAPVKIGDVIVKDLCGTGIAVVATRNAE